MSYKGRDGRFAAQVLAALCAAGWALPSLAQQPPDAGSLQRQTEPRHTPELPKPVAPEAAQAARERAAAQGPTVQIKRITFEGNRRYSSAELEAVVASYVNRPISLAEIEDAANLVAQYYRSRGWLARVLVPPQQVTLLNTYTTGSITSASASTNVGGLVGTSTAGTIRNSYSKASVQGNGTTAGLVGLVNGGTLDSVYATGNVTGTQNFTGGLIGEIGSTGTPTTTLSNAYATGTITSSSANVGGLVGGSNAGTINVSKVYAIGNATSTVPANNVGGLFGSTNGTTTITDSYATGNASGAGSVGGLVGLVAGGTTNLTRTYATGNVTGTGTWVGGLVGSGSTGATNINTSFATGNVSGTQFVGGLVGLGSSTLAVSDAYATGSAAASTSNAGGLVGSGVSSTLKNVYATGAVSGGGTLGGLMGTATSANYAITAQGTTTADITPIALTVGGINTSLSKTYDGTLLVPVDVSGATYGGLLPGDDIGLHSVGLLGDKNVGVNKPVTIDNTFLGPDAGNYVISLPTSGTATITPGALTISGIGAANKVYDGTTLATISTGNMVYGGLVAGDSLSVSATGSFTDKNAGTGKTVNLVSSYSGADVGNYAIADQATTNANITPKAINVSGVTAADKVYDGTTTASTDASAAVFNGIVAGDALSLSVSGQFINKNAGIGKTVNLTSSFGGADLGNYAITGQASAAATIAPRSITLGGTPQAQDKDFDGTTHVDITGALLNPADIVVGDQVLLAAIGSGNFLDALPGLNKPVAPALALSGPDAGNYSVQQPQGLTASVRNPQAPPTPPLPPVVDPNPPSDTPVIDPPPIPPATPADGGPTPAKPDKGDTNGAGPGGNGGTGLFPPPISGVILLNTLSEALGSGGGFVSVLAFDPIVAPSGTSFTTVLPVSTFFHSNPGTPVTLEATQADGSPLPDWLSFDAGARSFKVTAPDDAETLEVLVIARDLSGHRAQTKLVLKFTQKR